MRIPGTYAQPRTRATGGCGRITPAAKPLAVMHLPGQHAAFVSESGCTIIAAHEPAKAAPADIWLPEGKERVFHMSISHADRYPTWDEVADARYELIPDDVTMAMLLPPREQYVNVDEHCFHLWQISDRRAG